MGEILLKNIKKSFGKTEVLKGIDLDIKDSSFTIVLGPSGCGKSTLLRILSGLESADEGELQIAGKDVTKAEPQDRQVAMVFQNYALYPHMSVYKNVEYSLKIKKVPKEERRERVLMALRTVEMEDQVDKLPGQLSGGQRQRVALARAIVKSPEVFLMDEPLSNLDAKLRNQMRHSILELHKKLGTTFVYVTHDQTEAMTMGDKIVVMEKGIIRQADAPRTIYSRPKNVFTAGFIGSPQMNMLNGKLDKNGENFELDLGEERVTLENVGDIENITGKEVIAGIRPEAMRVADERSNPQSIINAKVELVEALGSESYLYISYNGRQMTARVSSDTELELGSTVKIELNARKIYLFDAATGEALI